MELVFFHADGGGGHRGFGLADQRLDVQHLFGIEIARLLGRDGPVELLTQHFGRLGIERENLVEFAHVIDVPQRIVVKDGNIAARHVGDVDVVPLVVQGPQRSAHRDHVVVGMRAENDDFLPLLAAGRVQIPPSRSLKTRCRMASVGPHSRSSSCSRCSTKSRASSLSRGFLTVWLSQMTARFSSAGVQRTGPTSQGVWMAVRSEAAARSSDEGRVGVRPAKSWRSPLPRSVLRRPGGRSAPCVRPAR